MIISAVIIISYTCLGGFLAASFTDLIQSIVMTSALVVLVIYGVHTAGGLDNVLENAKGIENYLSFTSTRTAEGEAVSFGGLSIISTLAWGLGYFGMPHILLRFMAIDDKNKVKISRRIASVWVVLAMGVAVFIGIIGNALTVNGTVAPLETSSKAGNHCAGNGNGIEQTQRGSALDRRTDLRRHSGVHHVYFRLCSCWRLVQYVGEPAERRVPY